MPPFGRRTSQCPKSTGRTRTAFLPIRARTHTSSRWRYIRRDLDGMCPTSVESSIRGFHRKKRTATTTIAARRRRGRRCTRGWDVGTRSSATSWLAMLSAAPHRRHHRLLLLLLLPPPRIPPQANDATIFQSCAVYRCSGKQACSKQVRSFMSRHLPSMPRSRSHPTLRRHRRCAWAPKWHSPRTLTTTCPSPRLERANLCAVPSSDRPRCASATTSRRIRTA
mmetsp:Transcript_13549/g.35975  ORF Transcript_13549/g.35975 Transcript_13549/m.35975 type:complete len:223 (-) Transcript_13549:475-1143(-)